MSARQTLGRLRLATYFSLLPALEGLRILHCPPPSVTQAQSQQTPEQRRERVSSCTSGLRETWGAPAQTGWLETALTLLTCRLSARTAGSRKCAWSGWKRRTLRTSTQCNAGTSQLHVQDIEGYYKGSIRIIIVCMCVIREQEARNHLGSLILLMASFVYTYCSVKK